MGLGIDATKRHAVLSHWGAFVEPSSLPRADAVFVDIPVRFAAAPFTDRPFER